MQKQSILRFFRISEILNIVYLFIYLFVFKILCPTFIVQIFYFQNLSFYASSCKYTSNILIGDARLKMILKFSQKSFKNALMKPEFCHIIL